MVKREIETKVSIARENQTDLSALVRANVEGLLRQMTHDHVIPRLTLSTWSVLASSSRGTNSCP